ncbi:hypothetical protein ASD25_04265 [Brevundimonas sp. Root1423]|nr:hypothetical protein ASD25_04265 [Brevundimonas sp. Root1423]
MFASALLLQQTPASRTPAPAATAEAPTATAAANAAVTPAEPAQTCRIEPVTGSRFGRRVCRNTAQTEEDRANSREMLRQMQGARTPPVG